MDDRNIKYEIKLIDIFQLHQFGESLAEHRTTFMN